MEAVSKARRAPYVKAMDIIRRKLLRQATCSPRCIANEVIQLDAGIQRIETVIEIRQVKMIQRIRLLPDDALSKQMLAYAWDKDIPIINELKEIGDRNWNRDVGEMPIHFLKLLPKQLR